MPGCRPIQKEAIRAKIICQVDFREKIAVEVLYAVK